MFDNLILTVTLDLFQRHSRASLIKKWGWKSFLLNKSVLLTTLLLTIMFGLRWCVVSNFLWLTIIFLMTNYILLVLQYCWRTTNWPVFSVVQFCHCSNHNGSFACILKHHSTTFLHTICANTPLRMIIAIGFWYMDLVDGLKCSMKWPIKWQISHFSTGRTINTERQPRCCTSYPVIWLLWQHKQRTSLPEEQHWSYML